MFVIQISSVSTKGFEISNIEKKVQKLERENRKLEVHIAEYRSMKSIQTRLDGMDMVVADNIHYFTPMDNAVARR